MDILEHYAIIWTYIYSYVRFDPLLNSVAFARSE